MEVFANWQLFILYSLIFFMSYDVIKKSFDDVKETKVGAKFTEKSWKVARNYCRFWFFVSGVYQVWLSIFFITH